MPKRKTSRKAPASRSRATTRSRPPRAKEPPVHAGGVTYQLKWIQCSKPACRKWHGPYWYAYWKSGRSTSSRYVGKALPDYVRAAAQQEQLGGDQQLGRVAREVLEQAQAATSRARRRSSSTGRAQTSAAEVDDFDDYDYE